VGKVPDESEGAAFADDRLPDGGEGEARLRALFPGASEMARRMRAFDWSKTDLGPPEGWPQNLKTSVRITLTSRHPMFVWWGERLINLYNDGYAAFLHAKHPAALGQPASEVWPEIWEQVGPRVEFAMHHDEGTYDEALSFIMHRKGYPEETYVTFSYSPIPDDRGGTGGILCPVTEETERIIGERQLALLRELAARCADARTWQEACTLAAGALATDPEDLSFALIYVLDREKRSASLAGVSGMGRGNIAAPETVPLDTPSLWPLGEVLSTRRARLVSDLTAASGELPVGRGQHPLKQVVAIPIAPSGETGTAAVLVVGLNPLRLFDDSYQRFLELVAGQLSAATANAEAHEGERRRAEALAELDRAKTDFFSNVSHEFRTPLTLMLGPVEEILAKPEGKVLPENRELLSNAARNGKRLLKLVNTLLDFSRIEAGRIEAVYEPTDLAAYTSYLAGAFRSAVERAGLHLVADCPPLPEPVYVDHEMWEKIVLNLLSNAFKFTLEGEVRVGLRRRGERVELIVADTGVGIPAVELPHVFERFHRVSRTRSRTYEGTGIGLALVQELVKLHGGEINVESKEGRGTTFTVSVPLGVAHLPKERVGALRARASTATGATPFVEEARRWLPGEEVTSLWTAVGSEPALVPEANALTTDDEKEPTARARILVADDNADMRQYVQHLLTPAYAVTAVADGAAALDAARREPPDLILADVMMPNLDGFGLLREVRSDPRLADVPVVLLSARAGEEATVEGLQAGADDYLIKPFSAQELRARVAAQIQRKLAEDARRESEERFRSYFELGLIGMAITSPTKGIIEVNDEICKILGYDRDELLRKTWAELTHPDDLHADVTQFNRVLAGEIDGYTLDKRWLRKDGRVIDATISVRAVRRADGSVDYFVALLQNITERKRMEEAMRERERFIRHISELSPVMLDVFDVVTGSHPYFSRDVSDLLGHTAEEIGEMEDEFSVLLHPDDQPRVRENIERLKRLGDDEINEFECRVRRGDELRWMLARSMVFVRDEQGGVRQVVNATLDITERKQAEEALRRAHDELEQRVIQRTRHLSDINEELTQVIAERERAEEEQRKLAQLFENSTDFIGIAAPEGQALFVNPAGRELVGLDGNEQARTTHIMDYVMVEEREIFRQQILPTVSREGRWEGEIQFRHFKTGVAIPMLTNIFFIKEQDSGRPLALATISRDITERRRAEEERKHLLRRLVTMLEEERTRIAREMHDQFGQGLTALNLTLAALRHEYGAQTKLGEQFKTLEEIVKQLDADADLLVWELRPTALDDLGLMAALTSYVKRWSKHFGVKAELHEGGMEKDRLTGEIETTLYRIMQEALTNIAKHAGAKNVSILLERRQVQVSLIVEDDGVGFDEGQAFGAINGGFGLLGMRERVLLVGGTLEIESEPGRGTTVAVRIPAPRVPAG
jgi:PAS domain S-box-containing protein